MTFLNQFFFIRSFEKKNLDLNNYIRKKKKKMPKELNEYFKTMLDAKKNNLDQFQYKGQTYKKHITKTGLLVYKKH